jgi:Flp pilus assembly protein TadD
VQGAKAAFRKGNASFQGGDYAEALRLFREAYRLDCTAHLMLMNMARTQELLGERRGAARTLRAYMKRRPNDPDAETIRRRIENLER